MCVLTRIQSNIQDFIEDYRESCGCPPEPAEIAEHFGLKISTVTAHLKALQRKNSRSSASRTALSSLRGRMPSGIWTIPLLGRICAGNPAQCPEYRESELILPAGFAGQSTPEGIFALRIQGESMRDLGILDGDIVIVTPVQDMPSPGDIVVALVQGGEATVKSFYPSAAGEIELRPANPEFQSVFVSGQDVQIQGKVAALQRQF